VKVLHVISRLNVGGTPKYIGNLIEGLLDEGYEVLLATGHVEASEIEDPIVKNNYVVKVPHLRRAISVFHDLKAFLEIRTIIKKFEPDIIHSHTFKAGLLVRLSTRKIPKIHTVHGHLFANPEFNRFEVNVIKVIEKILARKTEIVVTVGQRVGNDLVDFGIVGKSKTRSIPPGLVPFTSNSKKDFDVLAKNNIRLEEKPIVGWMGRFTEVKNPSRVFELALFRSDLFFIVAGSGHLYHNYIDHNLPNLLLLEWADTETIFNSIDILLSTSHNEGMPLLLIEAVMAGIPVVANDVGSVGEIVSDGDNGILCNDSILSYSEALDEILRMINDSKIEFDLCRARAIERFSLKNLVDSHTAIYNEFYSD
jgi:glycosyltransferase involved in cell wall biosynthesis